MWDTSKRLQASLRDCGTEERSSHQFKLERTQGSGGTENAGGAAFASDFDSGQRWVARLQCGSAGIEAAAWAQCERFCEGQNVRRGGWEGVALERERGLA